MRSGGRFVRLGLCLTLLGSCTRYDYEEEFRIDADGSGTVRVSASEKLWRGIHNLGRDGEELTTASVEQLYQSESLRISSVTETRRLGEKFVHVQMDFDALDDFCNHPANRHRDCGLHAFDDHIQLRGDFGLSPRSLATPSEPSSRVAPSTDRTEAPQVAFRFHLPAVVLFHNGDELERGNIVRWQEPARDYLAGKAVPIEVRMDNQSILALTLWIVFLSVLLVAGAILASLAYLHQKGSRQLRAEAEAES